MLSKTLLGVLFFSICGVPSHLEVAPNKPMPAGDAAVVCMDGFDLLTKHVDNKKYVQHVAAVVLDPAKTKSPVMAKFVAECKLRNLPLNLGKEVINVANSTLLGGRAGWCPRHFKTF